MANRKARPLPRSDKVEAGPAGLMADVEFEVSLLGEMFRRAALGLTVILIVARASWPAEYRQEADTGTSLGWSMCLLVTALVAVAGMWLSGGLRLRRSWADLGVIGLFILVAASASHAADRRIGINLAWEWVAVGLAYVLLRNLPRNRAETSAIVGCLVATAVAVSAYGLYQIAFEFPSDRAFFLSNPREAMIRAGLDPDSGGPQYQHFKDRLLGSREPVATFALTNTLAGFLVGPAVIVLVMGLRGLARRELRGSSLLAAPLGLIVLVCLLLTKSRSGYVGLFVSMLGLAWLERHRVSFRRIVLVGFGMVAVSLVLVTVAVLTKQLDVQVLTESSKSLRYRAEYWQGAWKVIWDGRSRPWVGVGPGNFAGPYLRHKLPQSSEEIADPHNLVLDVWAMAGLPAVLAMLVGLAFGLRECFGASNLKPAVVPIEPEIEARAPASAFWLVVAAGAGGWMAAVALGRLSPFDGGPFEKSISLGFSMRWLILSAGWVVFAVIGGRFWQKAGATADALGLGVVAIVVNLLAAGGIAYAPVSLMLWGLVALGQNLREDRRCGVRSPVGGRELAFVPAAVLAAILGTFVGTVSPFWKSEAAMNEAEAALTGLRADADRAGNAYRRAVALDPFASRGWIAWANLEYREWKRRKEVANDFTWHRIDSMLKQATKPPRDPNSLLVQRLRARWARDFLDLPGTLQAERYRIRTDRANACAAACALYPTDATLRADLAASLADLERFAEAVEQGRKATSLDQMTPHADKKLPLEVRSRLNELIPVWRAKIK